jgi:hypothetical protein
MDLIYGLSKDIQCDLGNSSPWALEFLIVTLDENSLQCIPYENIIRIVIMFMIFYRGYMVEG